MFLSVYLDSINPILMGENFAGKNFHGFHEFWTNSVKKFEKYKFEKDFCNNSRKFILHEMNFKGQLDKN